MGGLNILCFTVFSDIKLHRHLESCSCNLKKEYFYKVDVRRTTQSKGISDHHLATSNLFPHL